MWSEEEIDATGLEHIEKQLTDTELEKIKNNAETIKKNDTIEQIDRLPLKTEDIEDRKNLVENIRQQAKGAKTISDIKNILNQLLTTIE